ncbi:MAG: hypothetical protein ABI723_10150 [Bacteroidia bacterium]
MKKLILMLAAIAIVSFSNAQKMKEADVPAAVKESFAKEHPGVTPKWSKEKNGDFEAGWKDKNGEASVTFNPSGRTIEHEMAIAVADLPKGISDYFAKNNPGAKIKEASVIIDVTGKKTYEAEVKDLDYIFDEKGSFIKTEKD